MPLLEENQPQWKEPGEEYSKQQAKKKKDNLNGNSGLTVARVVSVIAICTICGVLFHQRSLKIQMAQKNVQQESLTITQEPPSIQQIDKSLDKIQQQVHGILALTNPLLKTKKVVRPAIAPMASEPTFGGAKTESPKVGFTNAMYNESNDDDDIDTDERIAALLHAFDRSNTEDDLIKPISDAEVTPDDPAVTDANKLNAELVRKTAAYIAVMNKKLPEATVTNMAKALVKHSATFDVPLDIVVGITHVESNFRPSVSGPQTKYGKALGPMQVMYNVHTGLLTRVGITSSAQVLTSDGGVKAGCFIFGRYLQEEKSITAALARYFSKLSSDYILKKVMSSALTFSQFESGKITATSILDAYAKEKNTIAMLISQRPAAPKAPAKSNKRRTASTTSKPNPVTRIVNNNSNPKSQESYARITYATPPRGTVVYKAGD